MAMFNPRPGLTLTGILERDRGGPETQDFKDAILCDFDIDSEEPKSEHIAYLNEVKRFLNRVKNLGSGRGFTIWIKGYASRTGEQTHNYMLSAMREQAIEQRLRTLFEVDDYTDLYGMITFRRDFVGFAQSPPGENAAYRAVRVTASRGDPPPPPVKILPVGSTSWSVRLVLAESVGITAADVAAAVRFFAKGVTFVGKEFLFGATYDEALFEITDKSSGPNLGGKLGHFAYRGFGFGISAPMLTGAALGRPSTFTTTEHMTLRDFAGDASFFQPPGIGIGILSYSVAPSLLGIQSHAFKMAECKTVPDSLTILDNNVLLTVVSSTTGWLTLVALDGKKLV
jgi:hypothetical protein